MKPNQRNDKTKRYSAFESRQVENYDYFRL